MDEGFLYDSAHGCIPDRLNKEDFEEAWEELHDSVLTVLRARALLESVELAEFAGPEGLEVRLDVGEEEKIFLKGWIDTNPYIQGEPRLDPEANEFFVPINAGVLSQSLELLQKKQKEIAARIADTFVRSALMRQYAKEYPHDLKMIDEDEEDDEDMHAAWRESTPDLDAWKKHETTLAHEPEYDIVLMQGISDEYSVLHRIHTMICEGRLRCSNEGRIFGLKKRDE